MTTEQHLEKIVAKCRANLELAANRTPGKWQTTGFDLKEARQYHKVRGTKLGSKFRIANIPFTVSRGVYSDEPEAKHDAAFIAACAGSAEAGWLATIAAIEMADKNEKLTSQIIAAWTEDIL